eukprot:TRINITY_DN4468_c0_g1_i1.p1 TRINITY_DN4468_c0_g1~~TRINITY_DN4468_c0_g1_i1.p1  ORF type:complete len:1049 (-),score=225.84 TRINITY_DN4468_c0_g1_i1:124-3270(-)
MFELLTVEMPAVGAVLGQLTTQQKWEALRQHNRVATKYIVGLCTVPAVDSARVRLIAITSGGYRLYFAVDATVTDGPVQQMSLVHVRAPPKGFVPSDIRPVLASCRGVFMFANPSGINTADVLHALTPDLSAAATSGAGQPFTELVSTLPMEGRVCAVAESGAMFRNMSAQVLPPGFSVQAGLFAPPAGRVSSRNELTCASGLDTRGHSFVLLTTSCVCELVKLRPEDQLYNILSSPDDSNMEWFYEFYGDLEAGAQCLAVACKTPEGEISEEAHRIAEAAVQAFYRHGGAPCFDASTPPPVPQALYLCATPTCPASVTFSARYEAALLYLARLLRPAWLLPVLRETFAGRPEWTTPEPQLASLQSSLVCLRFVVDTVLRTYAEAAITPQQTPAENGVYAGDGIIKRALSLQRRSLDEEAQRLEQQACAQLACLIDRALDAVRLLRILMDTRILDDSEEAVAAHVWSGIALCGQLKLSELDTRSLLSCRLAELACTTEGLALARRAVAVALNRAVVCDARAVAQQRKKSKHAGGSPAERIQTLTSPFVDGLSVKLSEACPSVHTAHNVRLFHGLNMLCRAHAFARMRHASDSALACQQEALAALKQVEETPIIDAAACMLDVGAYRSVVDLALTLAPLRDPLGLAVRFYKHHFPAVDVGGHRAYTARLECYQAILNVLDALRNGGVEGMNEEVIREHGSVLTQCHTSDDELLHYLLYQLYLTAGNTAALMKLHTNFVEGFLRTNAPHLLWKWLEERGRLREAADVLLGIIASREVPLPEKVMHLERALNLIASASGAPSDTKQIEIARLQLAILNELVGVTSEKAALARERLNTELLTVGQLLEYVAAFNMPHVHLRLLFVSGEVASTTQICGLWESAFVKDGGNLNAFADTVKTFGKKYFHSPIFPYEFLINWMEICNYVERASLPMADPSLPYRVVLLFVSEIGVPYPDVLEEYDAMYQCRPSVKDAAFWADVPKKLHLLQVIQFLVQRWVAQPRGGPRHAGEAAVMRDKAAQSLARYKVDLARWYMYEGTAALQRKFEQLSAHFT